MGVGDGIGRDGLVSAVSRVSTESTVRTIKRYTNRKLYDTTGSCYVTLEDIALMIRQGEDIQVFDNRTKEDLTHMTLAQIIFESQRDKTHVSSLSSLRGLIQSFPEGGAVVEGGGDAVGGEVVEDGACEGSKSAEGVESIESVENVSVLLLRIERLERQVMELAKIIQRLPMGMVKVSGAGGEEGR